MRLTKSTALGLVTAGAVAIPVLSAAPAFADSGSCDSGEVCLYENNEYNKGNSNHVRQWAGNASTYSGQNWYNATTKAWTGDGLNDEASSVKNLGNSCSVRLFQHDNGGGAGSTFARGAADPLLSNNNVGDNRATSHYWC